MSTPANGPSSLQIAQDIIPIGELKAHLSERLRSLKDQRRPLIVTQNGRPTAVLLSPEEYDRLTQQERFVAAVNEGLAQVERNETIGHEEAKRVLSERLVRRTRLAEE